MPLGVQYTRCSVDESFAARCHSSPQPLALCFARAFEMLRLNSEFHGPGYLLAMDSVVVAVVVVVDFVPNKLPRIIRATKPKTIFHPVGIALA